MSATHFCTRITPYQIMKVFSQLLTYLIFAVLLITTSCSDDENPATRRDQLTGTWSLQSSELVGYQVVIDGTSYTRSQVQQLAASNSEIDALDQALEDGASLLFPAGTTITFNSDNQYTLDDQSRIVSGGWSLSSDENQLSVQTGNPSNPGELNFDIESLSNQTVQFILSLDENDLDIGDEAESFSVQYRYNFSK